MKISSSRGLKNPQKLALGKKILPPAGLRPLGGKLIFGGEETRPIRKSYIFMHLHCSFEKTSGENANKGAPAEII